MDKFKEQLGSWMFRLILVVCVFISSASAQSREGYFDGTLSAVIHNKLSLKNLSAFSFKTCDGGELISAAGETGDSFTIQVQAGFLQASWTVQGHSDSQKLHVSLLDNVWHNVELHYILNSLILKVDKEHVTLANETSNERLVDIDLSSSWPEIVVGRNYKGCLLGGPNIPLQQFNTTIPGYTPGCMMPTTLSCADFESGACFSQPCLNHGRCVPTEYNNYFCQCTQRYSGQQCETDMGPLCSRVEFSACQNGGICQEDRFGNSSTCACPVGFSGRFCEMPSEDGAQCAPCQNGGTCQPAGDGPPCLCLPGFEGALCETSAAQCSSNPCQHGGTCTNEGNSHSCDCTGTGYHGSQCEVNINECLESNPCKHESTCFDRYGDYLCACPPGLAGKDCSQPLDACALGACQNGATCLAQSNSSFQCLCMLGFEGDRCEVNIDDCEGVMCPTNSFCVDGVNGFTCQCNEGFQGTPPLCLIVESREALRSSRITDECPPDITCSGNGRCVVLLNGTNACECNSSFHGNQCEFSSVPKCRSNPCQNGGVCKELENDYFCVCSAGWSGKDCDWNEVGCSSNPCMNGRCVDVLHSYSCLCDEGYSGVNCDFKLDFCTSESCKNGGTCMELTEGFHCNCPFGFMGRTCEEIFDACASSPCHLGGICHSLPSSHNFTCLCPEGLTGDRCQINIDDCVNVTCPPPLVCHDKVKDYECGCPSGFSGPECTNKVNECSSNPCQNGGTCEEHQGSFLCHCAPGFTGPQCQSDINECLVNRSICANAGHCENSYGTYQCFCRPGFTGDYCHIDIDECLSSPCLNRASCVNMINNYMCSCSPGYTGRHCETDIDECESGPCQNGATCMDAIDSYSCQCLPGFTGSKCEVNIDECLSSPCLHEGLCVDLINGYTCNCEDTGFTGTHCEINIDDCVGSPCQNDGRCEDLVKNYLCHCHEGYEGKDCQIDIPECASSPCLNGAPCLENSNRTLYDINYMGRFPFFSYDTASGYICICPIGFTGVDCEINIDDCEHHDCVNGSCVDGINGFSCLCHPGFESLDCSLEIDECEKFNPCENGATCIDKLADYTCRCLPAFGDKNCSTELLGCTMVHCQNNATCVPYLENDEHKFRCICPGGYTGELCNVSTIAAFSESSSFTYTHHIQESSKYDVTFQFRTTLPDAILLMINEHDISLVAYLKDGSVTVVIETSDLTNAIKETSQNLNDGLWHDVAIRISGHTISLNISNWLREDMLHSDVFQIHSSTFGSGRLSPLIESLTGPVPNFIGCMRDIRVGGQLVIPQMQPQNKGLEFECLRKEQCFADTCLNGGVCRDLWYTHRCDCFRPYFGTACENNVPAATYGYGNASSWSSVAIPPREQISVSREVKISTFLRSRQAEGLLFYLGPSLEKDMAGSQYDHHSSVAAHMPLAMTDAHQGFLAAFLHGGYLKVLAGGNGDDHNVELISTGHPLNDGNYHFIEVERNNSYLSLWVNNSLSSQQQIEGSLNSEVLYIGGVPMRWPNQHGPAGLHERKKRQTSSESINMHFHENVTSFKGIIRDFRLNNQLVPIFPLHLNSSDYSVSSLVPDIFPSPIQSVNVSQGELSNNPCLLFNPCENGGSCMDAWDAYSCKCMSGFRGTNCTEREPCSLFTCPEGATCQNLDVGYECVSEASFRGNLSLRYESRLRTHTLTQHSLSLQFRTQYSGGTLMEVVTGGHKLWIKAEDSIVVQWTLWPEEVIASLNVGSEVTDGQWHSVQVHINQTTVKAELKTGQQVIERYTEYNSSSLMKLLDEGDIILGGPDDLGLGSSKFKGCLNEVRVGGLLLPFFGPELLSNNTSPDQFVLKESFGSIPVPVGCLLCWPEDCLNGGTCTEKSKSSHCTCPDQYQGPKCEEDVDECLAHPCMNGGECENSNGGFYCKCDEDYTGHLCETEVDHCESSPCKNGGVCVRTGRAFRCDCTSSYKGVYCEELVHVDCSSEPCQNNGTCVEGLNTFTCHCKEGSYGNLCQHLENFCEHETCSHHGLCINHPLNSVKFHCSCYSGYMGIQCGQEVDHCEPSPCANLGTCKKNGTGYTCICPTGWRGINCTEDVNECLEENQCENNGICFNSEGTYECKCTEMWTGIKCSVENACYYNNSCQNGATCRPEVDEEQMLSTIKCECPSDFTGIYCHLAREDELDLALVIGLSLGVICLICIVVVIVVFLRIAKKKRATRGTYSPSRQEMFGSRVEMNHVIKPPPEERLI